MKIQSIVENITINIDGKDIEVPKGINIIEAVKIAGKGNDLLKNPDVGRLFLGG